MGQFIGYYKEHIKALYIRRKIKIQKPLKKVLLKLTALGVVKGFCNGEELDCDLLTPGWVDYHRRIPFYTYDITDRLQEGENVLAFTLGDGWAVGKIAWFGRQHYRKQPLMWCDIELEYADGTRECIGSDSTFKISFGQILSNDIFDGECWDARCDIGDFAAVSYDDSDWLEPTKYPTNMSLFEEAINPLTKKKETFIGEYLYEKNGCQVYDFAQNHAGVPEIDIRNAKEGTKLTFIYGEMLNDDGSVFNDNLRQAKATDTYICRAGKQSFYPHMTFHGYRYMGIMIEGECVFEQVRSRMIYSDIPFHASFECSDEIITKLYKNIIASQKSNFINVPTDCPQRDERLGWTGDAQVFCLSAMYNADCRDFWRKYLVDVIDAQLENGMIDSVAPTVQVDFDGMYGSPAWGDIITVLPYEYYCVYKDLSIIELALPAAKRWVQYCVNNSEEYVRPAKGYGDWLSINEETDKAFLGIMYMAYSALLASKMCEIVGDSEAKDYLALYEDIKKTIRKKFLLAGNVLSYIAPYIGYSQTEPYAGAFTLAYILERGPFYNVGTVYLLITLIVEIPVVLNIYSANEELNYSYVFK